MRSFYLLFLLCHTATAKVFSSATALRVNSVEFSKTMKGMHVLPPTEFFRQQLKNMCQTLRYKEFDFYLCHHLAKKQKYVVPILDHHEDEAAEEHVYLLELMPEKIYYYNKKPVAITSAEGQDKELRVVVPKAKIHEDSLQNHLKSILPESQEAR